MSFFHLKGSDEERFHMLFKPGLRKLVRETFPHMRVEDMRFDHPAQTGIKDVMHLRITLSDSLAGMALEEKQ